MNPFLWPGPEFLLLYTVLAAFVVSGLWLRRRHGEDLPLPELARLDPYAIAVLRGGRQEALRVAAAALVERGMLEVERGVLRFASHGEGELHPIESAVVEACSNSGLRLNALSSVGVRGICDRLREDLIARGLLPGEDEQREQWRRLAGALALLIGVAGVKVAVAWSTGHRNVLFLLLLAAAASAAAAFVARPGRTARGEAALRTLRDRLAGENAFAADASFTLAAAVCGLAALPSVLHPWLSEFEPRERRHSSASGYGYLFGGGCGSGDGGGGGGGSDGGGGGGCGGCGGGS